MNKKKLSILVAAAVMLASARPVAAVPQTNMSSNSNVMIQNNVSSADIIMVTGLNEGDTIKVYRNETSNTVIGKATVPVGSTFTTVSIPQLGVDGGTIYLTVTNPGKLESGRVPKTYAAEEKSDTPLSNEITVINGSRAGIVKVENLQSGDTIKVYKDSDKKRILGTAVVAAGTAEVSVNTSPLGVSEGVIYITVTSTGKRESDAIPKSYDKVAPSDAPLANEITVNNNGSSADIVKVENLESGDIIKVYRDLTSSKVLGTATVASEQTSAEVSITQLGQGIGKVYVTVTSLGKTESSRTEKSYDAEGKTDAPLVNEIFITNNKNTPDTITVENLKSGNIVKIYRDSTNTRVMGTATVAEGSTNVTVNVGQLSVNPAEVYVTVTSKGKQESDRTKKDYSKEVQTDMLYYQDITVINNSIVSDVVEVDNLQPGDMIKVYKEGNPKVLGSATATAGKTKVTVNIPQLGKEKGKISVTVTATGCAESAPIKIDYNGELVTPKPEVGSITVINNSAPGDTITVTDLEEGAVVRVYRKDTAKVLGTATVAAGNREATVTVPQLGQGAGDLDITITNPEMAESDKVSVEYKVEVLPKAEELLPEDITVTNNAVIADTVRVDYLNAGDIIKVYDTAEKSKLLGTAKVPAGKDFATVTIHQLGSELGKVYVTVTPAGSTESDVTEKGYDAEVKTDKLTTDDITIKNNTGMSDTVIVENLEAGDVVKVYPGIRNKLDGKTVEDGKDYAVFSVEKLSEIKGTVSLNLTRDNLQTRIMDFKYEKTADNLIIGNMGTGDIEVRVYSGTEISRKPLGYITANADGPVDINIPKLEQLDGKLYVSIERAGKEAQAETYKINGDTVTVEGVNNGDIARVYIDEWDKANVKAVNIEAGKADAAVDIIGLNNIFVTLVQKDKQDNTLAEIRYGLDGDKVIVNNLASGDIVNVYNDQKLPNILGSATVAAGKNSATVNVSQLGQGEGIVFVTTTSRGMTESQATAKGFAAEGKTDVISVFDITTLNNVGTEDTVKVENLEVGDTVRVYNSLSGGKLLGSAKVPSGKSEVVVSIAQLGQNAGKVYVSVTSAGKNESERIAVDFDAESPSYAPVQDDITIENNKLVPDIVRVQNLSTGDIVKVYRDEKKSKLLGNAAVAAGTSEAVVNIAQLGQSAGKVYISVTNVGKAESEIITVDFDAEPISDAPILDDITVENNKLAEDIVRVQNLSAGDIVKIYRDEAKLKLIGTAAVAAGKNEALVNIAQLGDNTTLFITVTTPGKAESTTLEVKSGYEASTDKPLAGEIFAVNNAGSVDTIKVINLQVGDIVNIYRDTESTRILSTATVAAGSTEAVVSVDQLGEKEGTVYVTVTSSGKKESGRQAVGFAAEGQTASLSAENIIIANNIAAQDEILVDNLVEGDIIKVYNTTNSVNPLAVGVVEQGKTSAVIKVDQLEGTSVFLTVTSQGKIESQRIEKTFATEESTITSTPSADDIIVANNGIIADTITVQNLIPGDTIRVYKDSECKEILASAVVAAGKTEGTVSIAQLGGETGSVYVKVQSPGKVESTATQKEYKAEATTMAPISDDIIVSNNTSGTDTVKVDNLVEGDIVKIYSNEGKTGKALGIGVVAKGKTNITINIPQLGIKEGSIFVAVTTPGKLESAATKKDFAGEAVTVKPLLEEIAVVNDSGIADTVTVENLTVGDVVKVYDAASEKVLGTATVGAGKTNAVVKITQLGADKGNIHVTVRERDKLESDKTLVEFAGEGQTDKLSSDDIFIANNGIIADTVRVVNLSEGDIIKVYDVNGTKIMGTATVAKGKTEATVKVTQLGKESGSVKVTVKSPGKLESEKTPKNFAGEIQSEKQSESTITITNNAYGPDTIRIVNLTAGDVVKVYREETSTRALAWAVVGTGKTEATVKVSQLGSSADFVWISVTKSGNLESEKVKLTFAAEGQSIELNESQITIIGK